MGLEPQGAKLLSEQGGNIDLVWPRLHLLVYEASGVG